MKRLLSIITIVALICTMFSGCGGGSSAAAKDDPNKDVTLTIAIPFAKQKDTDLVVAEINKKLETLLPHTKVQLMLDASMAEKWPLWMSTQKKIDIAHSGYVTILEDEIINKTYEPLNELVEQNAPNIKKLREEYWYTYDQATVNGELYAIPNTQFHINRATTLKILTKAVKYIDIEALKNEAWSSDKTSAKFWDILYTGLDNAQKHGVDCSSIASLTLIEVAKRGYTFIGGKESNFCYSKSDSTGKIIDFYETDEYKNLCEFMKKANSKGWVSKDILTGQWSDGLYGSKGSYIKMDKKTGLLPVGKAETSTSLILDNPDSQLTLTTNIGENSTYWSVPFTSQNPARAMKFLDLINSDEGKDIVNLMAYGIEGKHYEVKDAEAGNIKAFEYKSQGSASVSYGIPNWMVGNMLQGMYCVEPYTNEYKEYAKDFYLNKLNKAEKHALYGFTFDLTPIRSKVSQILKNNGEYAESIYSGIVKNADNLKTELKNKNNSAGYDDVMKELQKQADEYIKSK